MQKATASKPVNYIKWTDKNHYDVGKYASEHGNAAAVRNFKKGFPNIKESTVREFKKRYEKQIQGEKKKHLNHLRKL